MKTMNLCCELKKGIFTLTYLTDFVKVYSHVHKLYFNFESNFFPDDYNRVVLEPDESCPDSDYINASYVDVS